MTTKTTEPIVVFNDHNAFVEFTMTQELMPYYDIADHAGVDLKIIRATGKWQNVHGVPREFVEIVRNRFQPIPSEVLDTEFFKCGAE